MGGSVLNVMGKAAAGDLANANVSELLIVLSKENATRRKNRFALNWVLGVGAGILTALMLLSWARSGKTPDFGSLVPLIALIGAGAAFSSTHKQALKKLSEIQTKEVAGFLLEAYSTTDERDIREVCLAALPKALAEVTNATDIDSYQRGLLYKLLATNRPQPLVAAALQCSERIAGPEAFEVIERFQVAAQKHKEPSWQRLGMTALQILPTIRMRAAREIIDRRVLESNIDLNSESDRLKLQQ